LWVLGRPPRIRGRPSPLRPRHRTTHVLGL
jgi:hypothetical protein